jgi:hypothetical protein
VLAATIVTFHEVSPTAAYLLVPYFGWSAFAAALTANIYVHNPHVRARFLIWLLPILACTASACPILPQTRRCPGSGKRFMA